MVKEKINLTDSFKVTLRKNFEREHGKFITESSVKSANLFQTFVYDLGKGNGQEEFKLLGMFDIKEYVFESVKTGKTYTADYHFISLQFKKLQKAKSAVLEIEDDEDMEEAILEDIEKIEEIEDKEI